MKRRIVAGIRTSVRSVPLDEWYGRLLRQQYQELGIKDNKVVGNVGLSEVKLRLFLSLLDVPINLKNEKVAANQ
jgi:hypothetical protein